MKKIFLIVSVVCLLMGAQSAMSQIMTITVVEYTEILYGSESKMFLTYPDGKKEEIQLKGLFEITGLVRPKNLRSNDEIVTKKLNELNEKGWEIKQMVFGVKPEVPNISQASCIITRYILQKKIES